MMRIIRKGRAFLRSKFRKQDEPSKYGYRNSPTPRPKSNLSLTEVMGLFFDGDYLPDSPHVNPVAKKCRLDPSYTTIMENGSRPAGEREVGVTLYSLVKLMKPSQIIEVGCYNGASTICMAQAVMENGAGHIHAVEISKDSIDSTAKNLEEANLRSYVTLHYGNSADPHILSKLPKSELIFIDGDHSYEGAKRDIENYKGILSDDGFMVLHDTTKIMDLHKLVAELCEQNGLKVFTFATSDGDGISLVRKIRKIGVYPFR